MKRWKINYHTVTALLLLLLLAVMCIGMLLQNKMIWAAVQKENHARLQKNNSIVERVNATATNLESQMKDKTLTKGTLIDINGWFQKLIDKKVVEDVDSNNTVYKMTNGQLTFNYPAYDQGKIDGYINNMKDLYDKVSAKGTHLIYIQAPFKNNKFDNKLPNGILDTTNINADNFVNGLKDNNIPSVDLRDVIKGSNFEYSHLFFNTDHHWRTETAFWAYQYIMEYFKQNYGMLYNHDAVDENNFEKKELKQSFLGSQANRTGKYYGGVDDFTLMTPKFQTNYSFTLYNNNMNPSSKSGDFESTLIFKKHLAQPNRVRTIRDCAYFDINPPKAEITNHNVQQGKALIIEDSFGRPFSAFMSLQFQQTDVMDLRYYKGQSLTEYLKDKQYDYIIFIYNPGVFSQPDGDSLFSFK